MNLVPYSNQMRSAYDTFDSFFDDFFRTGLNRVQSASFPLDVEKQENQYLVTAEVPGMTRDNIDLDVEDGVLTISIHQEEEKSNEDDQDKKYVYRERQVQNAVRKVSLENVDEDHISAKLEDGLLKITLPIAPEVSNKKAITIE
jgi:HSP20 family protein